MITYSHRRGDEASFSQHAIDVLLKSLAFRIRELVYIDTRLTEHLWGLVPAVDKRIHQYHHRITHTFARTARDATLSPERIVLVQCTDRMYEFRDSTVDNMIKFKHGYSDQLYIKHRPLVTPNVRSMLHAPDFGFAPS